MPEFFSMSCPSCGGKLEVTLEMERFICLHCGKEHRLLKTGSTISISPIVEGIKQVQNGVDRTASELAVVRLQKKIDEVEKLHSNAITILENDMAVSWGVLFCLVAVISFVWFVINAFSSNENSNTCMGSLLFVVALATGGIGAALLIGNSTSKKNAEKDREELSSELKNLRMELENHLQTLKV